MSSWYSQTNQILGGLIMAKRSTLATLPDDIRQAFERKLAESGFANYSELTEWLQEQGFVVSRSSVHRYGKKIERRFAAIKDSTEAARLIADQATDEQDTRSEALMAMLQTELFNAMVEIGEIDDKQLPAIKRFGIMSAAAKNIAALTSASANLKQYQAKVKIKVEDTADKVAKSVKKGGLSEAAAESIRRQILGITT